MSTHFWNLGTLRATAPKIWVGVEDRTGCIVVRIDSGTYDECFVTAELSREIAEAVLRAANRAKEPK
jgi:hypothetical protein